MNLPNLRGILTVLGLWLLGSTLVLQAAPGAPDAIELRSGGIVRGPTSAKQLALVFTGHEFAEGAETILDELARRQLRAAFFLTGAFVGDPSHEALLRRMVRDGHYLGPHSDRHLLLCSWTQPPTNLVTREEFRRDLTANAQQLTRFWTPPADARYFLPPFEHYNETIAGWSRELGYTLINFTPGTRANADYTEEGSSNFVASATIFDSILARANAAPPALNGFLLLLHLGAGPGRTDKFHRRFGELLDALTGSGYRFVRVDELLATTPQIHVRANQVGYPMNAGKVAIALSTAPLPAEFTLVAEANEGRVHFQGKTRPIAGAWGRFPHHAELDFSSLRTPGRFVLKLGGARSLPFHVGTDAGAALPGQLLEFMRQQRCGYNPWLGTNCHTSDGRTAYGPLPAGSLVDASGGWHDAGDLLKYLLTSGNATAQMLLAYELGPKPSSQNPKSLTPPHLADHFDARGNPGTNGVADLLDEARWGLEWLLKLHPAPDQFYHQVADDRDHIGFRLPQHETADYGWGPGGARVVYAADGRPQGLQQYQSASTGLANLAGRYAAALALAWQIYRDDPRERAFAARCLQAGKEVYELGRAREGVQQGNSYKAPYRYEETTWADDMEWGAAELYRATREPRYLDEARRYARLAANDNWMGREQTGHYQYYPFLNLGHFRLHGVADAALQSELEQFYRDGIERCVKAGQGNPYGVGVPFIWCSDNLVVALATQCLLYERMTGETRYRSFAARQSDWLLGRNPWGYTLFTEIGSVFPTDVHLQTTKLTGRSTRGGLVDGPVYERIFKSLRGVSITEPDPLAAFQDERAVYHNDFHDYATNEPTMDGTASAILLWTLQGLVNW
jgi:endoglucanase